MLFTNIASNLNVCHLKFRKPTDLVIQGDRAANPDFVQIVFQVFSSPDPHPNISYLVHAVDQNPFSIGDLTKLRMALSSLLI